MEVIKAILSILVSVMFIFVIIQIAWPLIIIFGLIILFTVVRFRIRANKFQKDVQDQQRQYQKQANQERERTQSTRRTSSTIDVIDAEFTEEEITE